MVGIAGPTPALVGAGWLVMGARSVGLKVIDQVGNDMRSAGLPRELKVLASEHVTIQPQAEFHSVLSIWLAPMASHRPASIV
jgi:hypothetical protein